MGVFHDARNELKQMIEELGIKDNIVMPGFVPNEYLGGLYKRAFAYVFPSEEEGFGIPVIEAMKSGIPVIVSDQPALLEVGANAVLNFPAQDSRALASEMKSLKNRDLRQSLINQGFERANQFSRTSFFQQFHKVVLNELGITNSILR